MQIANLFRDTVIPFISANNMQRLSEQTLSSLEDNSSSISAKNTEDACLRDKLPETVSTLVNLASTALLDNEKSNKSKKKLPNGDEADKEQMEEKKDQDFLMNDAVNIKDNSTLMSPASSENRTANVNLSEVTPRSYNSSVASQSPGSLDLDERLCENNVKSLLSPLENSVGSVEPQNYKSKFDNCESSNTEASSQVNLLLLGEHKKTFENTFLMQEHVQKSFQTENNASSEGETQSCATNNISDMNGTEAENLVIHQHNHSNPVPRKSEHNEEDVDNLIHPKKKQCSEKQKMQLDEHLHQQPLTDIEGQHLSQQRMTTSDLHSEARDNRCNQYAHTQEFHECLRNNLSTTELSQQNLREQQISEESEDQCVEDYHKIQSLASNISAVNNIEHQHQYHQVNENSHNMMQQQSQHAYLQHHDQQHMIHAQQQQQHHSELMAYLHHQDTQAMHQTHHIRTYQHYQQRMHPVSHPEPPLPHHQLKHSSMTCIDELMIDEFHDDPNSRYKLLSPTVKHESQDDGYETSAGDVLTPNSHSSSHSMTPQHQIHSSNLAPPKCEEISASHLKDPDPYNFIDDEINSNINIMSPSSSNGVSMVLRQKNYGSPSDPTTLLMEDGHGPITGSGQHIVDTCNNIRMQSSDNVNTPKKRGRKKKGSDEVQSRTMVDGILAPIMQKERKKHDRFNGMPEEEVSKRTLPDHITNNLDIIIIGINPGLFAAYKGHHYAGPGNHFWKCLYLSGLTHEQMTAEEDYKLLKFGIGFTNMVERATKGSADLTRKEIKEGSRILLEKLKRFRPKIAVFNGKLIFEVFSGKKDFNFGRQQECVEGTDTYMWVMPSSSARCAQLPRAADKVPFYAALKKFRDYLNGLIPHMDSVECVFSDPKGKQSCDSESKADPSTATGHFFSPDCMNSENQNFAYASSSSSTPERGSMKEIATNLNNNNNMNALHNSSPMRTLAGSGENGGASGLILSNVNGSISMNLCNSVMHIPCNLDQSNQPEKKKRGRPKKIKGIEGEELQKNHKARNTNPLTNSNNILNLTLIGESGEAPKKKRGRPKKIKTEIGINSTQSSNIAGNGSNCSSNAGRTNGAIENNTAINPNATKPDISLHQNSPTNIGNQHHVLALSNSNQYSSATIAQHQSMQGQRLFTSPMHSPNTISSYCPMGMNTPTTPPIAITNANSSSLGHGGAYQQQQHGNHHHVQPHHNHRVQHLPHQLHIQSGMYLPSPNRQISSKSPHYGSSHSDLSSEISAAISSEHLGESQSEASPALGPVEYDRPDSIHNDERFASPTMNTGEQSSTSSRQIQHYHNMYQNPNSNQSYITEHNNSVLRSTPLESGGENANDNGINFIVPSGAQQSNSNSSTPQSSQMEPQHRLQNTDVTSKSLSGLESLVDQIPSIDEGDASMTNTVGSVECRIKCDSIERFPSPVPGGSGGGVPAASGIGCVYTPSYLNVNSSSSSSPSSAAPSNSSILLPHNYPDPIYSTANTFPSASNNNNSNINYIGLASNFSVSSLTSNNYPANSYHTNLMAAAASSSPHHITSTSSGSPMYMDPHLPVAVSPIYHHSYTQHAGYGAYGSVGPPPPPPPPTLHMPSPNYPYVYPSAAGYPNQANHHPSHSSAAGYLTNHPSMFDRIKPDIGYGGY